MALCARSAPASQAGALESDLVPPSPHFRKMFSTMRRTKISLALAVTIAIASPFTLAQKPGQKARFVVLGWGNWTCGELTEALERPDIASTTKASFGSWVLGFISGRNEERARATGNGAVGEGTSSDTILALVKKKCRDEPLKSVFAAASQAYDDIAKKP